MSKSQSQDATERVGPYWVLLPQRYPSSDTRAKADTATNPPRNVTQVTVWLHAFDDVTKGGAAGTIAAQIVYKS